MERVWWWWWWWGAAEVGGHLAPSPPTPPPERPHPKQVKHVEEASWEKKTASLCGSPLNADAE